MSDWLLKETLRYMGIQSSSPEEVVQDLALKAIERVSKLRSFRYTFRLCDICTDEGGVVINDHRIMSRDLKSHLQNCHQVYVLAATLGSEVDRLLARDSVVQPSLAVAEQAAATALIENDCDNVCVELENTLANGSYLLPRFSPGYGDCPLTEQAFCVDVLNATRLIGLSYTESFMLTPLKSITAFIGVANSRFCTIKGCALCAKTDCAFRKE